MELSCPRASYFKIEPAKQSFCTVMTVKSSWTAYIVLTMHTSIFTFNGYRQLQAAWMPIGLIYTFCTVLSTDKNHTQESGAHVDGSPTENPLLLLQEAQQKSGLDSPLTHSHIFTNLSCSICSAGVVKVDFLEEQKSSSVVMDKTKHIPLSCMDKGLLTPVVANH